MKKFLLPLILLSVVFRVSAQNDSMLVVTAVAEPDTAWKVGGNIGLQFNQSAYSNWQAGGINAIAGNALFRIFANYDDNGDWSWYNNLILAYGLAHQDTFFSKTDDRIELESRVDRRISENWNLSGLLNFRTQFSNGYQVPGERYDSTVISGFLAPAYTLAGLGFTYKPDNKFSAFLSPVTMKVTTVNDTRLSGMGAFGIDTGSIHRFEVGGYVNLSYKTALMKNVDLQAKLDLYSNYLDQQYKFVDINGEVIVFMEINDFLTANLTLNVRYDNDIMFDVNEEGVTAGPRTQFREVLGVGFVYRFGDRLNKEE